MADETRTILIDVEVEEKDFDKEIGSVNKELQENQRLIRDLKKDYSANSTEIAKLEAKNRTLSTSKKQLTKESQTEGNSLNALRLKLANLTKERNSTNTSTKEGVLRFKELQKEIKSTGDTIGSFEQEGGDFRGSVGNYPDQLSAAVPGFAAVRGGILKMAAAARAFIATPLGAVLALIVGAIAAVGAAFKGSEEGQNKFNKLMGVLNVILGNLLDVVADVGEAIISAFEKPQDAWESFTGSLETGWNFIRDQVFGRFKAVFTLLSGAFEVGVLKMRIAWNEFTDDSEEAEKLTDELDKVVEGMRDAVKFLVEKDQELIEGFKSIISSVSEATTGFINQTIKEANQAIEVAEKRAKADKLDRQLLIDRAMLESEIAALRLKSRQEEEFGAEARKQALLDAQVLEDQLLKQEQETLTLRSDAITLENTFSRSNKENLDAEAEAKAKVLRIEASRLNQQRSTQRELNRLNKEIEADTKRVDKEEQARLDKAIKASEELEIFRLEEEEKLIEAEERKREILLENEQLTQDERALIIEQSESKIGNLKDKAILDEIKRTKALKDLKIKAEQDTLNALITIFGQGTIAGKAFALTQIGFDTAQAISALTKNSEGNPANAVTFGGAGVVQFIVGLARIATNIAMAKRILSSSGSGGVGAGAGAATASAQSSSTAGSAPSNVQVGQGFSNVNSALLSQLGDGVRSEAQNTQNILQGISNLPSIQVSVTDINKAQNKVLVKESETSLGG